MEASINDDTQSEIYQFWHDRFIIIPTPSKQGTRRKMMTICQKLYGMMQNQLVSKKVHLITVTEKVIRETGNHLEL